jgi:hypothetical protein
MRSPRWLIENSTWMSRGLTYQKAICSTRHLVLTDQQVYFECLYKRAWEPFEYDGVTETSCRFGLDGHIFSNSNLGLEPSNILRSISKCSARNLTFDSDALNGMLGISRIFEDAKPPVYHYWGVPLLPSVESGPSAAAGDLTESLLLGLCWMSEKSGRRRSLFPSWS